MKGVRLMHSAKIIGFLVIFVIIGGCVSHRGVELKFTDDMHETLKKYPIRIRLELSDAYMAAKWEGGSWGILYGPELTSYSTILADQMFHLVDDQASPGSESNIDAVLIAEILSFDHEIKMWTGTESKISISQKWTLKEPLGRVIWIQTISGTGVMEMGTAGSEAIRQEERALLAIDDMIYKSAKEMSSSIEIQKFSKILASSNNSKTALAVAPIPQAQIERSKKDVDFTTINLLDHSYHMGDNIVKRFKNPKPQGKVFEGKFNIADFNPSTIFVTIWVSDMVPKSHEQFLRGYYKTKLVINDSKVSILNKHILGRKDNSKIEQITIEVDKHIVKKGSNKIKIIAGVRGDKNNYDDFQIHKVIVRYKK